MKDQGFNRRSFLKSAVAGGALAYWAADALKNRYLKNPAPLVSA